MFWCCIMTLHRMLWISKEYWSLWLPPLIKYLIKNSFLVHCFVRVTKDDRSRSSCWTTPPAGESFTYYVFRFFCSWKKSICGLKVFLILYLCLIKVVGIRVCSLSPAPSLLTTPAIACSVPHPDTVLVIQVHYYDTGSETESSFSPV